MRKTLKRTAALIGILLLTLLPVAPSAAAEAPFRGYDVPTANSSVTGITAGPDGNIWFTEFNGTANKVAKVTPNGDFTEYPLPTPGNPGEIIVGGDGNLWLSGGGGSDKIYRVTTDGDIQGFDITPAGSDALDMAIDESGNIWFTREDSQIGMRATDGTFSAFPVPTPGELSDITLGPDGNMWFLERGANKVGVITPGGTVTEHDVPTASSYLESITAGPDGNLWFTEANGNKVGRITTAGVITEYTPPAPWFGVMNDITTGPDGNLWITALGGDIVRFELDGTFTMYPTPWSDSEPTDLTVGPSGNIWFTDQNANKIGVMLLSGLPSPSPNPNPNLTPDSPLVRSEDTLPGAPNTGVGEARHNVSTTLLLYTTAASLLSGAAFALWRFTRKQQ